MTQEEVKKAAEDAGVPFDVFDSWLNTLQGALMVLAPYGFVQKEDSNHLIQEAMGLVLEANMVNNAYIEVSLIAPDEEGDIELLRLRNWNHNVILPTIQMYMDLLLEEWDKEQALSN